MFSGCKILGNKIQKILEAVTTHKVPKENQKACWSREDEIALVEYVALHQDYSLVLSDGDIQWPSTKKMQYWDEASSYMQTQTKSASRRSGIVNCTLC